MREAASGCVRDSFEVTRFVSRDEVLDVDHQWALGEQAHVVSVFWTAIILKQLASEGLLFLLFS